MERKSVVIAAALAAVLGVGTFAYSAAGNAQPYSGGWGYGPGWMHGWMMSGYGPGPGYGPGWMHGGYGPRWCWQTYGRYGVTGPGAQPGQQADQQQQAKLTVDDVKVRMERWLAYQGNPHIKLGAVKETGPDTITADIVTTNNSLVQRFDIDRNTGFYRPADENTGQPADQKEGR